MANTLIRIGSSYTVPVVPYQMARPAYYSFRTVVATRPIAGGGWVIANYDAGNRLAEERLWIPDQTESVVFEVATYHPAVPEVQSSGAQRVDNPPVGWTSFARSIASMYSGYAEFSARPQNAGLAIGLSHVPNPTPGYGHIPHGLLLSSGKVRNLRTGADLGDYVASDVFHIGVQPSGVVFKKNGTQLGTDPNTYRAGAPMFLSAAMYGALDLVDNPALVPDPSGASLATFPRAAALSADFDYSESVARFPKMEVASLEPEGGTAVFPTLAAFSSDTLSSGASFARFPAAEAFSYGGTIEVVPDSESYAQFPKMEGASLLLVGGTGESAATFTKLAGLSADYAYGESLAVFPRARAYSYDEAEPDTALLLDGIRFDVLMTATGGNRIDARDRFTFDVPLTAEKLVRVDMRDAIAFDVLMTAAGTYQLDMRDAFRFAVPMSTPGADLEVHAVNLDGYGSTTYAGYAFNSFARIGDRYYGAKLGGLFLLEGDSDAGVPIQAAICPGKLDFGSSQQKTVAEVYMGATSESAMVLKVAGPAGAFEYEALGYSEELQQHRFKLGKGLKTNYLTPVFYNQGGADFEIDSLEFMVADLSRKTRP